MILRRGNDMRYPNFAYDYQLTIDRLLERTLAWNPTQKIVYRDAFEYTYADMAQRVRKLAAMLSELGVRQGDAVAFMDWDSHRYLEAYFAVPMMGAVLHTVNVRLSPEQILFTINDAEDRVLVVHKDFFPIIEKICANFDTAKKIVVIGDGHPLGALPRWSAGEYEELLGAAPDTFAFPELSEQTVATAFYTTGTTGNPKGVFFTHRQLFLHSVSGLAGFGGFPDPISFRTGDVYMPLTPMFHVHAWGVPYIATMLGVKQVYPGRYEPEMLLKLLVRQRVTFSHCVPTILQMILASPAAKDVDLSRWKVIIGGSALPRGLAEAAIARGINITAGYGMSETCPTLTVSVLKEHMADWPIERRADYLVKAGFPVMFVDLRIRDADGRDLAPGKKNVGEIVARAPWLTPGYLKLHERSEELWRGGWLHTGDLAYRDEEGYIVITDRLKDVIKTGGEWISSVDLESLISQFEPVAEVAVIGVPDEKWGERPKAYIVERPGAAGRVTSASVASYLQKFVEAGRIEKWAIPEQIAVVSVLPKTSVGKIDKKVLRGDVAPQ
jgi:fatty-acyl-CoA synthase